MPEEDLRTEVCSLSREKKDFIRQVLAEEREKAYAESLIDSLPEDLAALARTRMEEVENEGKRTRPADLLVKEVREVFGKRDSGE